MVKAGVVVSGDTCQEMLLCTKSALHNYILTFNAHHYEMFSIQQTTIHFFYDDG